MAVTEVPFDLAEVKLDAPLTRPGTVAKADVIERLSTENVPFATVVAPAGYGKTTLLAQWAEADPRPFAWVALDGRDDDAQSCSCGTSRQRSTVSSLSQSDVFDALSGPRASDWPMRVPRIGRALAALERPLVLVLDDLHTVANPSCLDVLTALFAIRSSRLADRGREQGRAGIAACPLAGTGIGVRDRCRGSPAERGGGRPAAEGRRRRARPERDFRADRPDGRLAGRPVPRRPVDAGWSAEPGGCRRLQGRRPVRVRVLPPRAAVPAAAGGGRSS